MTMERIGRSQGMPVGVRVWRHGDDLPDWIKSQLVGPVSANGTFLIETPLGRQRVHRGNVVIEQEGLLYSCPANEATDHLTQIAEQRTVGTSPTVLVGPGKSLKSAIPKRTAKRGIAAEPKQRSYPPVRGTPPSIEWVAVTELLVDGSYQRSIETEPSRRLIASIAARWDWRLCMPLAVSRRADGRYVIDGQHRLAAARLRRDIPHLPCSVATYDGPADEAGMFVASNRARRAINRLDDFHAALVAGDEDALEVQRVVTEAGLRISRNTGSQSWIAGEVAFTSSIQTVLARHGEEVAGVALKAIAMAFPQQVLSQGASVFLALTRILVTPPEGLDQERLFRSLGRYTMQEWGSVLHGVKGGDIRAQAMRQALLSAYEDSVSEEQ